MDRGITNSFLFFPFTKCSICAFFTGSCRTRTTRGDCCVFPFIYRNRRYNRPTRINAKRPWCSLTSNYDKDKLFGYTGGRTRKRIREPAIVFSCFVCLFVCWINLVGFIYFISNTFLFSFSYLAVRPIRITPTIRREYYLSIKLFIHMFVCLFVNENY